MPSLQKRIYRKAIFESYYDLEDQNLQRCFIAQHVEKIDTKRKTANCDSRRKSTLNYSLEKSNKKIRVCKATFLSTLGIKQKLVHYTLFKLTDAGTLKPDQRGLNTVKRLDPAMIDSVKEHIQMFPTKLPHYIRKESTRRYLSEDLNASKMYQLYTEWCEENRKCTAKEHVYRQKLKEMKISFHRPRKDLCEKCKKYNDANDDQKELLKDDYMRHTEEKNQGRLHKSIAVQESQKEDSEVLVLDFDLQAVLYTPKTGGKPLFYKRKLSSYNLTIYDCTNKQGYCNFWPEFEGERGSVNIATCLYKHILKFHLENAPKKHIVLFCDSCGGQNKNSQVATMLCYLTQNHNIQYVDMRFFEPGHSDLNSDNMHSVIANISKHSTILEPYQWISILSAQPSKKSTRKPYIVSQLAHSDFIDWKKVKENNSYANFSNGKCVSTGIDIAVKWRDVKIIRASKQSPHVLLVSTTTSNEDNPEWIEINLRDRRNVTRRIEYRGKSVSAQNVSKHSSNNGCEKKGPSKSL